MAAAIAVLAGCGGKDSGPTGPAAPSGPTYSLNGTVRDGGNRNLLAGVSIRLTGDAGTRETATAFEGEFSFSGLSGTVTVTASAVGYEPASVTAATASTLDLNLRRVAGRSVPCGQAPDISNRVLPMFSKPFTGEYPITNYFDHDLPNGTYTGNGYQLTFCDQRIGGRLDTHQGYDWLLPGGTPLLAVADGQVLNAGTDSPFFCATLGRTVSDQRFVEVRHAPMNGEQFTSVFVHLSRLDVSTGQTVARGQVVGLSGNTGCSTEPHLHLQVWRLTHTNTGRPVLVDPYGWEGATPDPWSDDASGAGSIWLWRAGEAPALTPR
jgi:murein DD-endopeptidase MepM/ murein hydrolase activator NlpD